MNKLNVFFEDKKVGEFRRDEQLVTSFQYSEEWLKGPFSFPLSIALPLQKDPFPNKTTLSFFENLLPEGDVRKVIGRDRHLESPFEFLKEFGQDCAGAFIITSAQTSPFSMSSEELVPVPMDKVFNAIDKHHSVAKKLQSSTLDIYHWQGHKISFRWFLKTINSTYQSLEARRHIS